MRELRARALAEQQWSSRFAFEQVNDQINVVHCAPAAAVGGSFATHITPAPGEACSESRRDLQTYPRGAGAEV